MTIIQASMLSQSTGLIAHINLYVPAKALFFLGSTKVGLFTAFVEQLLPFAGVYAPQKVARWVLPGCFFLMLIMMSTKV